MLRVIALTGVLLVCALALGGLAIAGWVVNVADSAPNLSTLPAQIPGSPSQVFAADGQSLGYIYAPTLRTPVAGSEIPQPLKNATIAIEDRRFWHHGALDYQGILRAAIKDVFSGGGLQGASTLTMQLVNNVYMPARLKSDHDLKYKIIQAKLAEQLEGKHSKEWVLNSYLNDVPYGTVGGQTAYGVGAASQMFFDKPVSKLTLAQAALLAGLPQAPSQYNPFIDRAAARQRRAEVLQSMVTAGYITQAKANTANRKPLEVKSGGDIYSVREQPYVFDYIQQQVAKDLCPRTPNNCPALEQGGLKIYTTIDLRKQALAQQAILDTEALRVGQNPAGTAAAALASINPANGNIEALATSSNYSQTKFDYADAGSPSAWIVVQGVRADDADPRLPRRPELDLLHVEVPAGRVAVRGPDLVRPHRRGDLPGHDQHHQGDDRVRQHGLRAAGGRPRVVKARRDGARDGDHLAARRQSRRGDRRAAGRRHAAARWPTPTRRSPTAARTCRPRSSARSCSPTGATATSATRRTRRCSPTARPTRRRACSSR